MTIPTDPDTLLGRAATASALTGAGYPVSAGGLANKAVRGDGPPFRKFGKTVTYRWGDALAWAESRTSPARVSTAEHRAAQCKRPRFNLADLGLDDEPNPAKCQ